jgi:hypothetical protein
VEVLGKDRQKLLTVWRLTGESGHFGELANVARGRISCSWSYGIAGEKEARMRAMSAAKTNVSKMLDVFTSRSRQLRREEITSHIGELRARKTRGCSLNWRSQVSTCSLKLARRILAQ